MTIAQDNQQIPFHRRRILSVRLIWICVCILAITACLEVALRLIGFGDPVLVASDSACGYFLKPNQSVRRVLAYTRTNRWGMRSDEFPEVRTPGTLRLLFLGDSITFGTARVDQHDIFTEVLHRELPALLHRPVEVLNASAGGWAIGNELGYLRSRGIFGSDCVISVINSGDLGQVTADMSQARASYFVQPPGSAMAEIYDRFLSRRLGNDPGDITIDASQIREANLKRLGEIKTLAEQSRAGFAVVYFPFKKDIPLPSQPLRVALASWCKDNGIPFVDLTDLEAGYQVRQITLEGTHLNRFGNSVVAAYLLQQPAVRCSLP